MKLPSQKATLLISAVAFSVSGCAIFESRPVKQMAYAEAAVQGATLANAETNPETVAIYTLARDHLARARSFYRLKNFKECRKLAVKARQLAEEAEWKALRGSGDSNEGEKVEK